ncbi:hypothetical protein NA56DRAFT_585185, partial [Hyaloscypha hepaticicola]
EFIFWDSFIYNHKDPCYIWEDEIKTEKVYIIKEFKYLNNLKEDEDRAVWELKEVYYRVYSKRIRGKSIEWRYNKANRAYMREKGYRGID